MKFQAGDFVSCRDPNYFKQLGVKKNVGIVLENKKSAYKVMFDDFAGGYWLNEEVLSLSEQAVSKWVQEVSQLVKQLRSESFDYEKRGNQIFLELLLEQVSFDELEKIKKSFGKRLTRLDCLPHMMAEIKLVVGFEFASE